MGRTNQELQDASVHAKYEIDMLLATTSFLAESAPATDQVRWNAYLESFVLHLRNLIDFFFPPQDGKGLILAEHYVTDVAKWNVSRGAMTPFLLDAKRRANTLVAHLSYRRLVSNKIWEWATIRDETQRLIGCFLNNLPRDRKAWFGGGESEGPTGPTDAPIPSGGAGATGPAAPSGSGQATTRE